MTSEVHPTVDTDQGVKPDDVLTWARERAEALQGLYIHLLVFVVINGGLFGINALTRGDGGWWFHWPLLIWGLGLVVHLMTVVFPVFSDTWVERRAEEIVSRHR